MKKVAIVIPFHRQILNPDEEISLRHLRHHLSRYDHYLLFPDNVNIPRQFSDTSVKRVESKHFRSVVDYCLFLTSLPFYDLFSEYEFILIYHLDALVFSDRLLEWCDRNYDFVGAPWYKDVWREMGLKPFPVDAVGNSGFSLRKVETCQRAILTYEKSLKAYSQKRITDLLIAKNITKRVLASFMKPGIHRNFFSSAYFKEQQKIRDPRSYEDTFWAFEIRKYFENFKIPDADTAVDFSFETGPRYCLRKNKGKLPFGCHAWNKLDRAFWEPHLLR